MSTRRRRMPTEEHDDLLQRRPVLELPGRVRVPVPRELSRSALRTQACLPGHAAVLQPRPVSTGRRRLLLRVRIELHRLALPAAHVRISALPAQRHVHAGQQAGLRLQLHTNRLRGRILRDRNQRMP